MRSSIITSVALATLTFMGTAKAQQITPSTAQGIPKTFNECRKEGSSRAVCEALFSGLKKCEKNHSTDEENWEECVAAVEANYVQSTTKGPMRDMPYVGEESSVRTKASDADYRIKGDDHKGFLQSDQ